uniref:ATP synthase subunit a n=1 Tax=Carios vespertilionis TaxID=870211 RepID=A0A8B0R892_9ACAR|nr:ATP synthase F0 subunit 6 [Carios vespertilionis]QTW91415.1 ATP synthase F0 subunit 6 [Carios vespertilionis]QTW91428.1 ATP synthase F0 subunit 6 [Carios vespertilionis]
MMANLFTIFDPSTSPNFSLNWISVLLPLIIFPYSYWIIPSRNNFIWTYMTKKLLLELKNNFSKNKIKFMIFFMMMFWFILINNMMGLFPYVFTATSHINLTSFMALPMWMSLMLYGWTTKSNFMFAHLVPTGTPGPLSIFMVCIETISNLIRPLTLAIRLSANMISGHLLLCLLSNMMTSFPFLNMLIFVPMSLLLSLETAVALIQSYVFIILMSLYLNELN